MPIVTNFVVDGSRYDIRDTETAAALQSEIAARTQADQQLQTAIDNISNKSAQWHIYNALTEGLVTDPADTSDTGASNTAALNSLLASCEDGSIIFFPVGRYHFDSTIFVNKKVWFVGGGRPTLFYHGGSDFFNCNNSGLSNVKFDNLSIRGEPGKGRLIIAAGNDLRVENCELSYCATGILLYNHNRAIIKDSYIVTCQQQGISIDAETGNEDTGDHSIINCTFDSADKNGSAIYLRNGGGLRIVDCKILSYNIGIHVDFSGNSSDLIVSSTSIERQSGFYVYCTATGSFQNVQIIGCQCGVGTGDGLFFDGNVTNILLSSNVVTTGGSNKTGVSSKQSSCWATSCALGGFETQYNNVVTNNPITLF